MSEIRVPDIGGDSADVIEILVRPGDAVSPEQTIVVLESAKASMEVPCPEGGVVVSVAVTVGQRVAQGDVLLVLDSAAVAAPPSATAAEVPVAAIKQELEQVSTVLAPVAPPVIAVPTAATRVVPVKVPDIGSDSADVIEILVQAGEVIAPEQPLVVLESAKASMEVPSPLAGVVRAVKVAIGDKVSESVVLLEVEVAGAASAPSAAEARTPAPVSPATPAMVSPAAPIPAMPVPTHRSLPAVSVHAGPAVRRLARELGVDLARVKGSGPRERILKDDVHAFVKQALTEKAASAAGNGLPPLPVIDFAKWGEVERVPLSKIQKVSAQNLHRAWVNIPHVTQFDEADITELEAFRVAQKDALKAEGLNLTVLAFLVAASARVLRQFPKFNSSLDADGEHLVQKKYVHIGVAVDTPNGLVVPVIRDADHKSLREIASDLGTLSAKARDKKLTPGDMQGACFSISSLGGIGGTAFTPIVNWPEVAILGVSRAAMKPVWDGREFRPRLMLPLSLSYDHRVIDGADAARFTTALGKVLADIRVLLL